MQDGSSDRGSLVCVIPTVAQWVDGRTDIDVDFASNLEAYLEAFDSVTVLSPPPSSGNMHARVRPLSTIAGRERLNFVKLPEPYREDRYIANVREVRQILTTALQANKFRLISPHAAFDWSTLAAEICIKKGLRYNMESDWNLPEVTAFLLSQMTNPVNRARKTFWARRHENRYNNCLKNSALALSQAGDVYTANSKIAPNAFPVLNIQLGPEDQIDAPQLNAKIASLNEVRDLRIVYCGRAIAMKGPFIWIDSLSHLKKSGVAFKAQWFGDGDLISEMQKKIDDLGLSDICVLRGQVDRSEVFREVRQADLFVFCHLTQESPRCLAEALANGTPIVGFRSDYANVLTEKHGGARLVDLGDAQALSQAVAALARDPEDLGNLMRNAASSGKLLDRTTAISERIALMKKYLG